MVAASGSWIARGVVVGMITTSALVGACGPGGGADAAAAPDAVVPADCASGDAAAGRVAVGMRACTSCHAADLGGATTGTPGPNLTPTNLEGWSDHEIARAILDGEDETGERLCTSMTRFRIARMEATEVCNIVAHLRSLDPIAREVPDTCM